MERTDTRQFWKRELNTLAQYFAIAVIAGVGAFVWEMVWITSPVIKGERALAINLGEAWANFRPVLYGWLAAFSALASLRLLMLFVTRRLTGFR